MRFRGPNGPKGQRRNYSEHTIRYYIHSVEDLLDDSTVRRTAWALSTFVNIRPSCFKNGSCHRAQLRSVWQPCGSSTPRLSKRLGASRTLLIRERTHRLPAILSQEEVAQLIDAACPPFHRTLLMTLYATGVRCAELTHLKVSDVDKQAHGDSHQRRQGTHRSRCRCSAQCYSKNSAHIGAACGENRVPGCFQATATTSGISRSIRKRFGMRVMEPPSRARSRKVSIPTRFARRAHTNHLSEKIHSKANCCWPGAVHGGLRPHRTALTCSWTAGNPRSFRSITHGAHSTTCVAGKMRSRISCFTTVLLTWSSLAACSCVSQSSCF